MQTAAKLNQCQFHTEVSNVEAKKTNLHFFFITVTQALV